MGIESTLNTPLADAVRRARGQSAFARIVRRPQSTVFDWLKFDKPLPAEHVLDAEAATGVSRHDLRPDIYPAEATASPGAVAPDAAPGPFDRSPEMKRTAP